MRTKMPTDLRPGDRLAAYGVVGRRLHPSVVVAVAPIVEPETGAPALAVQTAQNSVHGPPLPPLLITDLATPVEVE